MGEWNSVDTVTAALSGVLGEVIAYLPRLLTAVLVVVAGWLVARLLRSASIHLVSGLDRIWQKLVVRAHLGRLQPRQPPTRVVGELVFWLVILFFITAATQVLGLDVFVAWLTSLVNYVPVLLAGLLIVVAGLVLGSLGRDLVSAAATSAGLEQADLLGRAVQLGVLVTAVVIGVDQIGIDIAFLSLVAGVVLTSILGGVALAFALGARTHAGNVIAAQQVKRLYRAGDQIRVLDVQGVVLEITAGSVIVQGSGGRIAIPAKLFMEEVSTLLPEKADAGE